jgi:hypothetical protein
MRSFLQLFVLIAIAGMALAQSTQPKAVSPFEQELLNNEKQFHEAFAAKNVGYVSQAISADFRGIGTNGDFYGREELVGIAHEGLPKDYRAYDMTVVQLSDSSAIVTYNEIVPGSHPRYLHVSDTWSKQNGQWKLRFQQATPNLWSATDLD